MHDEIRFLKQSFMTMPNNLSAPTDLPALIAQGEGETLEFKRSVAELEQVVETVVALANTRGGLVLIGDRPRWQGGWRRTSAR